MPKVRDVDEAYIKSQENEGWECLPDRYDDRGYTGGNMAHRTTHLIASDALGWQQSSQMVWTF